MSEPIEPICSECGSELRDHTIADLRLCRSNRDERERAAKLKSDLAKERVEHISVLRRPR